MFNGRQFDLIKVVFAIALVILAVQLGAALIEYVRHAQAALTFAYPLDYDEGPILDQAIRLSHAENIYRKDLSSPPYTISLHPPLFQLLQVPFVQANGPEFWYGRAISVLSVVLAALFIALIVQTLTTNWIAALIGGLTLLAFPYILHISVLDRVDSLALALSLAGLFAIVRWPQRWIAVVSAAILFIAATYTQQAYWFAAPAAALIWLIHSKCYRQGAAFVVILIGLGAGLFLLLNAVTSGGFYSNIVTANLATFSVPNLLANWIDFIIDAFYLFLGALVFTIVERTGDHTRSWPLVIPYLFLAMLASVGVVTAGRGGSNVNALFEPIAALSLLAGALVAWPKSDWAKAGIVLLLAVQINSLVNISRSEYVPLMIKKVAAKGDIQQLALIVRDAKGPVLLDEYNGLIPLTGKPIYFQPAEFTTLSRAGKWDPGALIASIRRKEFPAIVFYEPHGGPPTIVVRWADPIRAAIYDNYDLQATLDEVYVYMPKRSAAF